MEQFKQARDGAPFFTAVPMYQQPVQSNSGLSTLSPQNIQFWKGVALGAVVTLVLTNESVQKGLVRAVAKMTAAAQSGIEEMKEKFEDAKAEAVAEAGGN